MSGMREEKNFIKIGRFVARSETFILKDLYYWRMAGVGTLSV